MKLKHLLHPIRSARRIEELEDRVRELEITLRADHQWLAHDPIARALTKRYLCMTIDSWASYAPEAIDQLRDRLRLNPYRQTESIPEGMALVPREITAETGHKVGMIGDFFEHIDESCPECEGAGCDDAQICDLCKGRGRLERPVAVSWTTIKAIHRRVVEIAEGGR
ncbi:hypothetical protein A8U91_04701 [Halomonas elongata]|uniref:Uncharacterized protein n=1 Tax=Halomonas elongata TaxID=2746 RepID=A0A1B8P033_HALEL|nr:hypothetical protein [Halomonas elongata]OBX35627.1 hypothetical protein A8U91_04701 [Halomonas elongata]